MNQPRTANAPGSWLIDYSLADGDVYKIMVNGQELPIALAANKANARLIAAAPAMLEALEQALDDMQNGLCVCPVAKEQIRAAITLATEDSK